MAAQSVLQKRKETSNFKAKCVNGNRSKGIYNAHLNIRSLANKIFEVKNLVKEHKPNILEVSECELRKTNNHYDETKLKVPGYKVLFPKSWATKVLPELLSMLKKVWNMSNCMVLRITMCSQSG